MFTHVVVFITDVRAEHNPRKNSALSDAVIVSCTYL
jgi:hypothetical protein